MRAVRTLLPLLAFVAAACSDATSSEPDACVGDDCGRPTRDAGADGTSDGGGAGSDADPGCDPGTRVCVDATTSGICLSDGASVEPIPCGADEACVDGVCGPAPDGLCVPGSVQGCASPTAVLRCDAEGANFVDEPCPDSAPYCRDGVCGAEVCTPDVVSCQGPNVVQCNSDGSAVEVIERCTGTCRDGACVELTDCAFDGKVYLGCDFWAVYLDNEARGLSFGVTVSNPGARSATVDVLDAADVAVYSGVVPAGGLVEIDLSSATQLNGSGLSNAAYRVRTDAPVTVHQFNPPNNLVQGYSNDASLLLPSNTLGTEYRVMAYYSGDDMAVFARLSARWYVTVVAAGDEATTVSIETPAAIAAGAGVPALAANATHDFTLQPGEVLNLQALNNNGDDPDPDDPADMTGMRITSTAPIAVFSGSEASYIPDDTGAADHLEQQLYPLDTWGTEVVLAKFESRGTEDDVYRVMAAEAGTTLTTFPSIPGVDGRVLNNAGDAVEFIYDGDFVVQGSAPISVGQFMVGSMYPGIPSCTRSNGAGCAIPEDDACAWDSDGNGSNDARKRIGDPAFLLPVPSTQYRSDYTFLTPAGYVRNYVSITHPPGATITLDDVAVSATASAIAGTSWSVTRVPVDAGTHRLEASAPVGLSVYGYGCDVSYAYPGGLNLDAE